MGATDEREPDDRRVAIRHRQAGSLCRPLRGSGSSLVGPRFLGLTPPGYELSLLRSLRNCRGRPGPRRAHTKENRSSGPANHWRRATRPGFEPGKTGPKPVVIPFHHRVIVLVV